MGKKNRKERKAAQARGTAAPARRTGWPVPPGLLFVLLLGAAFVVHAWVFRFTQDDAYISLRYARNLVEGHGLVFNPGERVEGYSNFTWTMLLALSLKLGLPAVETSRWLGILFGVGTVLVAARFARALEGRWGLASVITAALVAGNSAFALWSTGGLETAMFAFLVTAGLERGLAPGVSERGRSAAPVLLALGAMTRPDGPLVLVLWFAVRALDTLVTSGPASSPGGRRGLLRDAALALAPLAPYAIWKLAYYGDLLPNTYYAKAGTSLAYLTRGLDYARKFTVAYAAWGLAPLLALASLGHDRWRGVEARLLFIWIGFAAYVVVIGGDVLYLHRFWLAIVPIGCVLVARGATWVADWVAARRGARDIAVRTLPVTLAATVIGVGLVRNWDDTHERRENETSFVLNMAQTGHWLKRNFPSDAKIAITTIGAISWFSELHVIDMLGLTDREIARNPNMIEGLHDTWREIKYNAESVLSRRPDAIFFSTGVRPSSAAEKALYLYRWFYEAYFPYYFRSVPVRTNLQVAFRTRPDTPPFHPTRMSIENFAFLDEYTEGHLAAARDGDSARASEHFSRAWDMCDRSVIWVKEWVAATRYDSDQPGSVEMLQEVVAEYPYASVAMNRLGEWALRQDDLDEAERLFLEVRGFDPDDSLPWLGLSEVARLRGDVPTAFEYARQGMLRWDANPGQLVRFGHLAAAMDHLDMAAWAFDRALRIDPELTSAREGLQAVQALLADGAPGTP